VDFEATRAKYPGPDAGVCGWIVEARWAHPLWHSYEIACYHLRPLEGFNKPRFYTPNATHEMILFALDPDSPRTVTKTPVRLHPANFAAQFWEADDTDAERRIQKCVEEILAGQLNPDTDYTSQWVQRFNRGMLK
jgi:hypothetical protein